MDLHLRFRTGRIRRMLGVIVVGSVFLHSLCARADETTGRFKHDQSVGNANDVQLKTGQVAVKPLTDATVEIDPTVKYQTFEGWGVSLCWWAKVVGSFPDEIRENYIDKIFDPKEGLGLTVVRYNIGGGENPSKNRLPFRANIEGFEPAPGRWDWKADAGQRWVLQQAKKKGANLFEAFSNSPPYWMTISGSVTGEKNGHNNLASDHEKDFAEYLATVLQHFRDREGVDFRTVEPFNEPNAWWWKPNRWWWVPNFWWWRKGNIQEGCHFDHKAQARCIQAVAKALAERSLPTRVSAPDENSINDTLDSVRSYSRACLDNISQINTHSYHGEKRSELRKFASASHKILWQTEYGDDDASGLTLSSRIVKDMHQMHPAAWIYWQAVDGPKWGLLTNKVNGTVSSPRIGKKYWVMANYSRFIHSGSVFIEAHDEHSLAALNSREGTVTIVTTNQEKQDETITYDLSRFDTGTARIAAYCTSPSEDLAPIRDALLIDKQFKIVLPAQSVTTIVLSGVQTLTP